MGCQYTYTSIEVRRGVAAYQRFRMKIYTALTVGSWLFIGLVLNANFPATRGLNIEVLAEQSLDIWPLILGAILITLYSFSPLMGYVSIPRFRQNPLYDQNIAFTFLENGFKLESAVLTQTAAWSTIGRAWETKQGFILFWGKSKQAFYWLPKSGFASEQEISDCRELLQRHLPGYKRAV
jgi:hypothetical protein